MSGAALSVYRPMKTKLMLYGNERIVGNVNHYPPDLAASELKKRAVLFAYNIAFGASA